MSTSTLIAKNATTAESSVAKFFSHAFGQWFCVVLLLAIAILRIVATYHVFNHTIDEPSHIAGGIEWWEKGTYTLETKHTPLARISVALGPYLTGVRGTGAQDWTQTYPILSATGHYWRTLILGRMGVLPYFVIAAVLVFLWTRRLFGASTGLIATAIFTQLPTILAHSSLATTDMALTAMFCCAVYAFTLWLNDPVPRTAALWGVFTGLALTSKFSTLVFLPACAVPIVVLYARARKQNWRPLIRSLVTVVICAGIVTWAVYRFSHAPLSQITKLPERTAARIFGSTSRTASIVHTVSMHVPVPAPELLDGIRTLRNQNSKGSRGYLLGRVKNGGWWYFFFVALAVKTPLAALLLAAVGSFAVVLRYRRNRLDWEAAVPLVCLSMLLIATTPSRLDSGIRYVLPVFVFVAILAAYGLAILWAERNHRTIYRAVAILLFTWTAISSVRSHPDYLSYFNELAGRDPSKVIVVGDLDWGQDLTRLASYLHAHNINHLSMVYTAYYLPQPIGLPNTRDLKCGERGSGWVAVELRQLRLYPECYLWLGGKQPVTKVGKTMLVYYLPGS